eukprot:3907335-Pyramimonas_sp.AAC.1
MASLNEILNTDLPEERKDSSTRCAAEARATSPCYPCVSCASHSGRCVEADVPIQLGRPASIDAG